MFAFDIHWLSIRLQKKRWFVISGVHSLAILSLSSKQMRKDVVEERVKCFERGSERQINKLYGAWPKIWSNCPLYWLKAWVILADIVPPYEQVRERTTLTDRSCVCFCHFPLSCSSIPVSIAFFFFSFLLLFLQSLHLSISLHSIPCCPSGFLSSITLSGLLSVQWEVTHSAYRKAG